MEVSFSPISLVFGIFVAAGMFGLYRFISRLDDKRRVHIHAAGAAHGLTYFSGEAEARHPNSTLLGVKKSYVTHGLLSGEGIELGEANFVIRSNDKDVVVAYNYIAVDLPKDSNMHLLIDSRHNNLLGRSILDTADIKGDMEKISLEGTFPRDYQVFQVPDQQISTLQLLNPLAMQQLVESFQTYDIEIRGNKAYLYCLFTNALENADNVNTQLEDGERLRQFLLQHLPRTQY